MLEALATALHLGAAEPLAQPARARRHHHYAGRRRAAPAPEQEPTGVWPVLTAEELRAGAPEPRIVVIGVALDGATFDQRWWPLAITPTKGDRLWTTRK